MAPSAFPPDEMICEQHLAEQTIEVGPDKPLGFLRCTLERCHVVVRDTYPAIRHSRLIDCTIECTRKMTERGLPKFTTSEYVRCKFIGRFQGVDFGRWPYPFVIGHENGRYIEGLDEIGGLIDCDFTKSTLDLCRFFSVDISQQRLAPWPQFAIPHEREVAAAAAGLSWPGKLGVHIQLAPRQNSSLVATTGTVAGFMKHYKLTAEEVEQALEAIGGVLR